MLLYIKVILYSWLTKGLLFFTRTLNLGSGTSIGGVISEKWLPEIVSYYQGKYSTIIYITGTNGKTTTRSLINHLLEQEHKHVCSNRGGANIFRGIVSTLISDLSFTGKVLSDILVLEVEEATLPRLTRYLAPDILVITNIFRDQLDAYGEIDKTLEFFKTAITACNPLVIANRDDAKLITAIAPLTTQLYGFGVISDETLDFEPVDDDPQVYTSKQSSSLPVYTNQLTVSLRPDAQLDISPSKDINKLYTVNTQLAGVYNLYNIAAALQTASLILDSYDYIGHISSYQPAFGRGELINYNDTTIQLFLVKNPAGYNSVLNHITKHYSERSYHLICALNDKIADGHDVSWIWDIDFEHFIQWRKKHNNSPISISSTKTNTQPIYTLGTRRYDMLLRLQYAGADVDLSNTNQDITHLLTQLTSQSTYTQDQQPHQVQPDTQAPIIVLATYTALLQIRAELQTLLPEFNSAINDSGN